MTVDSSAEILNNLHIDRTIRARYLFTFTPLLVAALLKFYIEVNFNPNQNLKLTIAEYLYPALIAISFISALLWYLHTGFRDRKILEQQANFATPQAKSELAYNEKISELESKIKHLQTLNPERIESTREHTHAIQSTFNSDLNTAEKHNYRQRLNLIINLSRDLSFKRIKNEISRSGFRGIVYLTTGVCLAILGILGLAGFVFPGAFGTYSKLFDSVPPVGASEYAVAIHYTSRFSLIISIEILAYFFLRLHKSNLVDAKYYQNELTNLELKYISLDAALYLKRADITHKVISEFSETERNHILEKGQSTIELKRVELEKNQFIEITKSLVSLAPKSK
ncbi:hypothetical protein [Pseudomonas fluorescens]|uniref:Uncharacterized protein n=3 Tax=Pseudomonas fluorescens TaxID=294 RepID=A0ABY1T6F7_PSEFL|nr:hypothetical protein [Pseudomonas fluorescens]MCI4602396.1 hypothetical protein [Pseudomonas fluorescens]RMO75350.1 hypothetical protein ALQ35_04759 [Pseudomonas fluorescens]TWR49709.1 hypothetical protein FIP59_00375 [Pseudomonas fluorescens]UKJ67617.1 hypothetical protein H1Q68_22205 [Pseudomonas fluorescens]SNY07158.1 hypothetical protein SAMN04488487_0621 [Pseudomonas fluorescens]